MLKTDIVTPTFRASYPSVFKPQLNKLSGKQEFSLEALFEVGTDLTAMKKAAENACVNKWGTDKKAWPKNLKSPFRDQKEKEKEGKLPDGCTAGAVFMRLKSTKRPGLVDQNKVEIMEESQFYAGCFARAHVSAFAYSQAGNNGVSFGLNHVQFVKDGDPFSGRPNVESAFTAVEGAGEASDAASLF